MPNSIRIRNTNTIAIAVLFTLFIFISCKSESKTNPIQKPTSNVAPLRDLLLEETSIDPNELIERLRESAQNYITGDRSKIDEIGLFAVSQWYTTLERLEDVDSWMKSPPVLWLAGFGTDPDTGKPFVDAHVINPNKETQDLILLFGGPNGEVAEIICRRDLKVKDPEFQSQIWFECKFVDWDEFIATLKPTENTIPSPLIRAGQKEETIPSTLIWADQIVAIPTGDGVTGIAAVRDRNQKISNFVPMSKPSN